MKIKAGDIAVCSRGALGLITEDMPKWVTYKVCIPCHNDEQRGLRFTRNCPQCERGYTFVGVHLTDKTSPIGSPWASREPNVVGNINALVLDLVQKLALSKEMAERVPYDHRLNPHGQCMTGHMCCGGYKTFAAEYCPTCSTSRFNR